MIRPPTSHVAPPGNMPMFPPQTANKLSQQMQGLSLGPSSPQHPGMPSYTSYPDNQQMVPGPPPLNNQQFPSPHHNKSQNSTNVTYSTQPKATYPYLNNNPPGNVGIQQNVNNNQYSQSNIFPGQVMMSSSPMSPQAQKGNKSHTTNPLQAYSANPTSINSSNYSNGISNGHDDSKQPWNSGLQSYQSPHPLPSHSMPQSSSHQGQVQYPYGAQNRNLQPQQNASMSPLTNTGPPVQQYASPNSQITQSSGHSVMNNQSLPPVQPGYQQHTSQLPNMPFPPNMSSPPTSPVSFPPGPQQYHGMPPNQPSPQFPGMTPQSPSNYPYGASNQTQQQPPKIDLDQMPNTVQVRQEDKNLRSGYYSTDVKGICPPLVTTNFIVQDRGMCSPRFIRSTVYCLPNNPDILKQTAIPFAITVSPLAAIHDGEREPPACLYREQGPLRCKRCKAYVCSFMTFMEGGRCFQCAFCKVVTEVPQDYFCFLDGLGERTDKYHRPELCLGSYEFPATKEYCRKDELPNPPAYIFMIEVSNATFRNGLVPLFCENLKNILQCLQNDKRNDTSKLRVGFVTYNNVLHFYNLKKNLTQPHIMVLSDVHNAFVPLLDGFLVTLSEAEALVDCLMEHIPRLFVNEPATEIILGPVIQVGLEALKNANCSGKLLVFHSTIPNADAPGKLPHREGQKLLGTDKQKIALSPQNDFYSKLAQECVAAGCAVDLFLFPSAYIDIASISPLCKHTGGQMYKYTYFQSHIDGDRFLEDLERNITTTTAFDAVLRIRTSAGISPVFYYGNFYMSNATDIELSALDCHKAITVEFAYDDKLPENETVFIQAALLYTTCTGERRIRVHNLAIATSVNMPDVFRCCELDAIINFFAKQALKQLLDHSPQQLKNNIINRTVKILTCYRKHCATSSVSGQLILPDTLKLLPLYINCVLKSDAVAGGPDMSLDDRSFAMLAVNSMDVKSTAIYFYPNLIPLHEIDPDAENVPSLVRCSIEKLHDNGVYLLENGIYMFLWIGQAVSPKWLEDVFGVQSTNLVDKQKTSLPELNTPLSKKIRQIIEDIEEGRQWYMRLTVMVQGDKLEVVFRQFLVEDRGVDGSPSYVDFLCHLHREISKNL